MQGKLFKCIPRSWSFNFRYSRLCNILGALRSCQAIRTWHNDLNSLLTWRCRIIYSMYAHSLGRLSSFFICFAIAQHNAMYKMPSRNILQEKALPPWNECFKTSPLLNTRRTSYSCNANTACLHRLTCLFSEISAKGCYVVESGTKEKCATVPRQHQMFSSRVMFTSAIWILLQSMSRYKLSWQSNQYLLC